MPKRPRDKTDHLPSAKRAKTSELRDTILRDGVESSVKVNQRALIDKMLARYAGNYSTFRELIQNSDDAGAKKITIEMFSNNKTNEITNLTEIRISNNGRPFSDTDWERISKIAEGNPDEQTVGMFGVGFYSVFSFTENPIIYSNGKWLAFHWKGNQLRTSRIAEKSTKGENNQFKELTKHYKDKTLFLFSIRDPTLSYSLKELCKFLKIALYFSKSLTLLALSLNGKNIFKIEKTIKPNSTKLEIPNRMKNTMLSEDSLRSLMPSVKSQDVSSALSRLQMKINSIDVSEIILTSTTIDSVDTIKDSKERYIIVVGNCTPSPSDNFSEQCERVLKKKLPKSTKCSVLFQPQGNSLQTGKIFVGISTHQRTGCQLHLSGHFYPTIERENIDFQDSYLGHWNLLLMFSLGQICRLFYDFSVKNMNQIGGFNNIQDLTSVFQFGDTEPQQLISDTFSNGFFSLLHAPLLETANGIKESSTLYTCDKEIISVLGSLAVSIPSQSYFQDKTCQNFFKELEIRQLISVLPLDLIKDGLKNVILSVQQTSDLISWILEKFSKSSEKYQKNLQKLLKCATYKEDEIAGEKSLRTIKTFSSFANLPVPANVLSYAVSSNFAPSDLESFLLLKKYSIEMWITDFLRKPKRGGNLLLQYASTLKHAETILSFLSNHTLPKNSKNSIIARLKDIPCIPCISSPYSKKKLLKRPNQAALGSCWNSKEDNGKLFIVDIAVSQSDCNEIHDGVITIDSDDDLVMYDNTSLDISRGFLKKLGVRVTPPASVLLSQLIQQMDHNKKSHISILEDLYQQRKDIRDEDWKQIRNIKFLHCFCLGSDFSEQLVEGVTSPSESILSIEHFTGQNTFSHEKIQFWKKTVNQFRMKVVKFIKPPNFEIVSLMQQKLNVHCFPSVTQLFTQVEKEEKEAYFQKMRFFFTFYSAFYKKEIPKDAYENYKIFLSADGSFYSGNELCAEENKFRPVLHPRIVELSQKFEINLKFFGIRILPPVSEILSILADDPFSLINNANGKDILEYLNETKITPAQLKKLKSYPFVPTKNGNYVKPSEIIVPGDEDDNDSDFEESEEEKEKSFDDFFPFVDFGKKGNEFLRSCGANTSPSPVLFANAFSNEDHCSQYFDSEDFSAERYLELLESFASKLSAVPFKFLGKIKKSRVLLGAFNERGTEKFKLCYASECNLIDNTLWNHILKPCYAPVGNSKNLIALYSKLGSPWLTSKVQLKTEPIGRPIETQISKKLSKLIKERYPLFLYDRNGQLLEGFKKNPGNLLTKLKVREIKDIKKELIFEGKSYPIENSSELSMCALHNKCLYLYSNCEPDYFDIGLSLAELITVDKHRIDQLATTIAKMLDISLLKLNARGWPVQRILGENCLTNCAPPLRRSFISLVDDSDDEMQEPILIDDFFTTERSSMRSLTNVVKQTTSRKTQKLQRDNQQIYCSNTITADNDCSLDFDFQLDTHLQKEEGINLYRSPDSAQKIIGEWRDCYDSFLELLRKIVPCIPNLQFTCCNIFLDRNSSQIAFNYNRSLYFNLRYYYQCHYSPQESEFQTAIYWFITICHELAHNEESKHNKEHERIMESLIHLHMRNLLKLYQDK